MKQLDAIHINSYFLTNKIHHNFYKVVTKTSQAKFLIPVYKHFKEKHVEGVNIDYIFTGFDRAFFFTKLFKVLFLFYKKRLHNSFSYVHAHTLISDGLPALIISLIHQKRYVVTVRGTDVHFFISKSILFKLLARVIINKAAIVFFVSPSYRERIKLLYPALDDKKYLLLPNGVDDFWIKNNHKKEGRINEESVNLLFIGRVSKQKNLSLLIDFIMRYDDRKYNLSIVGPNDLKWNFEDISNSIPNKNTISYYGEVRDMEQLLMLYRQNDIFVMLSPSETFGIVYVEALTQGLPIIYTRGDGIDGYFDEGEVGYSCDHNSVEELKTKIDLLTRRYEEVCNTIPNKINAFEWDHLNQQYIKNINARLSIASKNYPLESKGIVKEST